MIYKLTDKFLENYEPSKLLDLDRAKARRFIIMSSPDKYGAVRVWELGMARKTTYHISFLEEDTKGQADLENRIFKIVQRDYTVDLTKKDGFTRMYKETTQLIMAEINNYIDGLCAPTNKEERE